MITVLICTYNPIQAILNKALDHLRKQDLPLSQWELVVIDNKSPVEVESWIDLSWHPTARVVKEPKAGLMNARIKGCEEAKNEILVFIDDDNFAAPTYLSLVKKQAEHFPKLGAWGGKSLPVYEQTPPDWFSETGINLGCRDMGNEEVIHKPDGKISDYPEYAPIGTGLIIRKSVFEQVIAEIKKSPIRLALGRTGEKLISGEDNDMMLTVFELGWELGYFPDLVVNHGIPAVRISRSYLAKMAFESNKSWLVVLAIHGICPWNPISRRLLFFRIWRSYFAHKAWKSDLAFIRWKGSCGIFEGRAVIRELNL